MYANDEIERQAPLPVRRLLLDFGGVTPTGRPMWRLVRAGDCRILCRGRMHHFARGKDLDLVRDGVLSAAASRRRGIESMSTKLAHELKNPLTYIVTASDILPENQAI